MTVTCSPGFMLPQEWDSGEVHCDDGDWKIRLNTGLSAALANCVLG